MKQVDVVIIGAGPAGLTASIYATRANLKTLVIDNQAPGGQVNLTGAIDNYPGLPNVSGFELSEKMYAHAESLGAEFLFDNITEMKLDGKIKTIKTEYSGDVEARAVIIATGASPRRLAAKNADKFEGHGLGYCATCDGAFAKGKEVAVVGGGNAAAEEVLYLSRIASKVHVFHMLGDFQCNKLLENELYKTSNVEIHLNTTVEEVLGDKKIEGARVKENGIEKTYDIQGLFVSIGRVPSATLFADIEKDKFGYILANEDLSTNIAGVFVAGDVRQKMLRQIVTATADGAIAATSASKYLLN